MQHALQEKEITNIVKSAGSHVGSNVMQDQCHNYPHQAIFYFIDYAAVPEFVLGLKLQNIIATWQIQSRYL